MTFPREAPQLGMYKTPFDDSRSLMAHSLNSPLPTPFGWVVVGGQENYNFMSLVYKFNRQRKSSHPCCSFWLPGETTHKCNAHLLIARGICKRHIRYEDRVLYCERCSPQDAAPDRVRVLQ